MEKTLSEQLRVLRDRSGLTMKEIALACGWKGGSSYQHYERQGLYKGKYFPLDVAKKLARAFKGHGDPPITEAEVIALAGRKLMSDAEWDDLGRQLQDLDAEDRADIIASIERLLRLAKKRR